MECGVPDPSTHVWETSDPHPFDECMCGAIEAQLRVDPEGVRWLWPRSEP
jgi:hypothetical protein